MRLFSALLWKNGRVPQNINKVPFKANLPLTLRDRVSGKSDRQKPVPCLQELTTLFAALRDNEFNEELCAKETAALRAANREYLTNRYETKKVRAEGTLVPGKDLHYKQLNNYLKLFPSLKKT